MRHGALTIWAAAMAIAASGWCVGTARAGKPYALELQQEPPTAAEADAATLGAKYLLLDDQETIYAPVRPPRPDEGINDGGVNFNLNVSYLTAYVYRGIDRSKHLDLTSTARAVGNAENFQFDGEMEFNLGRLPHPFVGLFVNVFNNDPVSRFQEVRPYLGLDWKIRPFDISVGQITYIFPERDGLNTQEVFAKVSFDDSVLFHTAAPMFSPYAYGAFDYDRYNGYYLEAGVKHDFEIEETGIVVTAVADVAYVTNNGQFASLVGLTSDSGFQHFDLGLVGTYPLNNLLNIPRRYGEFDVKGYLFYTDGIDNKLRADTQIWGGIGIGFRY